MIIDRQDYHNLRYKWKLLFTSFQFLLMRGNIMDITDSSDTDSSDEPISNLRRKNNIKPNATTSVAKESDSDESSEENALAQLIRLAMEGNEPQCLDFNKLHEIKKTISLSDISSEEEEEKPKKPRSALIQNPTANRSPSSTREASCSNIVHNKTKIKTPSKLVVSGIPTPPKPTKKRKSRFRRPSRVLMSHQKPQEVFTKKSKAKTSNALKIPETSTKPTSNTKLPIPRLPPQMPTVIPNQAEEIPTQSISNPPWSPGFGFTYSMPTSIPCAPKPPSRPYLKQNSMPNRSLWTTNSATPIQHGMMSNQSPCQPLMLNQLPYMPTQTQDF
jgi:hypothetical protein